MQLLLLLIQYWQPAAFAFLFGLLLVVLALRVFPKIGLIDRPHNYGLSRKPIPYYGGLVLYIAFLVSVLIFVPMSKALIGLLIGATLVFSVGFLDDLLNMSPFIRMLIQFCAALVLVFSGIGLLSFNLPFLGTLDLTSWEVNGVLVWSAVFTVIWVMVIVNTMNLVDGISGLSSGVTFIAGLTLFVLSIHPGVHENPESQIGIAMISLILAMVALAFFIFDIPKPKILMGDSGSTFFGFIIAALAIFSGGKVATAFLVLGIPILDMVWVMLRRILSGQKFWKGDLKHLHHRLLDLGISHRGVVFLYLLVTFFFGLTAVLLVSSQQKFFTLIALIVMMLLLASALVFIPKKR